jgi:protein-L-isoaspartate(D-aspartate) O-methyltransferase
MSTIISFSRTSPKAAPLWVLFILLHHPAPAIAAAATPKAQSPDPYVAARRIMVDRDLRSRGIRDERVLAVMEALPRHLFVPENVRDSAYEDRPLPIGAGQTISQPYIVARMSELLELKPTDRVLEIGTGSGYQTAVLARLAASVSTIEILPSLSEQAQKVLNGLNLKNVAVKVADGFYGWQEQSPFDAILLTAAAPRIPEPLWRQLRDHGRLVMPLGEHNKVQRLIRARKTGGQVIIEDLSDVLFVPLRGAVEKAPR